MRLHRIEVLNLNSLYGEQILDLDKDLAGANLFLIHGRTGSGKSTLMDAVSLALFAKTPRLDGNKEKGAEPATIMSRGTGECRATVEFSKMGSHGERLHYRASWSVRRAKKKSDGNFQAVERSLEVKVESGAWNLLVSGKKQKEILPVFDEVLEGFTSEDFQRSMLLAQGKFDALLDASGEERASILERLTNTGDYKRIGAYAAKLASAHRLQIKSMEQQVQRSEPASLTDLASAESEAMDTRALLDESEKKLKTQSAHLRWLKNNEVLAEGLENLEEDSVVLDVDWEKAGPLLRQVSAHDASRTAFEALDKLNAQREREELYNQEISQKNGQLRIVLGAVEGESLHAVLAQERAEKSGTLLDSLHAPSASIDALVSQFVTAEKDVKTAKSRLKSASQEQKEQETLSQLAQRKLALACTEEKGTSTVLAEMAPLVALRNAWEQSLRDDCVRLFEGEGRRRDAEITKARNEEDFRNESRLLKEERERLRAAHAKDNEQVEASVLAAKQEVEALVGEVESRVFIRSLRERSENLRQVFREAETYKSAKAELNAIARERLDTSEGLQELEIAFALIAGHVRETKSQYGSLSLRCQESEKHAKRLSLVSGIAKGREALQENEPCALCGALVHPYAKNPSSCPDDAAIASVLHDAETEYSQLRREQDVAEKTLRRSENEGARKDAEIKAKKQALESADRLIQEKQGNLQVLAGKAELSENCTIEECASIIDQRDSDLKDLSNRLDKVELALAKENQTRAQLHEWQDASRKVEAGLLAREARALSSKGELSREQKRIDDIQAKIEDLSATTLAVLNEVGFSLSAHAVDSHPAEKWTSCRAQVERKLDELHRCEKKLSTIRESVTLHEVDAKNTQSALEASSKAEQRVGADLQLVQKRRASLQEKVEEAREQLNGLCASAEPELLELLDFSDDWQVDQVLKTVQHFASQWKEKWKNAAYSLEKQRGIQKELQGNLSSLAVSLAEAELAVKKAGEHLQELNSALSLSSVPELESRRMASDALELGQRTKKELEERRAKYKARAEERKLAIATHAQERPSDWLNKEDYPARTSLEEEVNRCEYARREAEASNEKKQIALSLIRRQNEEHGKVLEILQKKRNEADVWLRMGKLIGTGEGRAFQEYAQGLNLHRLVVKANLHLSRLSNRFQLTQREKDGVLTLDFEVDDCWQVGPARSPRSLSGGERFLVSLALALGLSDLRSHSLPIETLLLDEGFGTLDSETLDVALAALQRLQADGRQVGVISHVIALKERIAAQVRIVEEGAGRSKIQVQGGSDI